MQAQYAPDAKWVANGGRVHGYDDRKARNSVNGALMRPRLSGDFMNLNCFSRRSLESYVHVFLKPLHLTKGM